jgi:DNA polymerase IV (archaeal DinB-like DNA polymerase)
MSVQTILHVDMDYFFAQIEERDNPGLKGRPVIVCMISERQGSMGAVAACNYLAREKGIRSGMPCSKAKKLASDGAFLPARKKHYQTVSDSIMEVLDEFGEFEKVSVDEAYIDITEKIIGGMPVTDIICRIKEKIMGKENLTCSVGAGSNKLIAKMASRQRKPDGHFIVPEGGQAKFLGDKGILELHGVGEKTAAKLRLMGVKTIGELTRIGLDELAREFGGSKARKLFDGCRGIDESPVIRRQTEQIGRIKSMKEDTRDIGRLDKAVEELSGEVSELLTKNKRGFRTVTLYIVFEDMVQKTKSKTLPQNSQKASILSSTASTLMNEVLTENARRIRRVGITASNLAQATGQKTIDEF